MELLNNWVILLIPAGLILGSFLNVCIYRIPRKISVVWPASFCPKCKRSIAWWQNLPLISFLILKGRCFYCNENISLIYPLIEVITLMITITLFSHFQDLRLFLFYLFFFSGMIVISGIDISHRLIPNILILILLLMGIIQKYFLKINTWPQAISGLMLATLFALLLRWSANYFFRKESLGSGDVKLSGLMGFYLGFELFLFSMFLGSIIGLLFQLFNRQHKKTWRTVQIPLAPFLSIGAFLGMILIPLIDYPI